MECGKTYLYLRKKIATKFLFAFIPARCKSWSCPTCRPVKARIVQNYVKENFQSDNLYMLTLTFYHSGPVVDAWKNLGACWNRLRTYVAKTYGKFSYLRIVEPHKQGGWPHMHILIKGCVINSDILRMVPKWGFGWNSQVESISSQVAAHYVSKYLSKEWPDGDADVLRIASKCRVVSVSRGMPAIFTKESEWEVVKHDQPGRNAKFMCNGIIDLLLKRKASYIHCSPFADGFIIESDTDLPAFWMDTFPDPYVWEMCVDYSFDYLPYGLQQVMRI